MTPEQLAQKFHETYERLAPDHGYETRPETAIPWQDIPEDNKNKHLMIAVCSEIDSQHIEPLRQLLRDFDAYTSMVTPRSARAKRLREQARTLLGENANANNPNPEPAL